MNEKQIKRNILTSASVVVIAAGAMVSVFAHSNIRTVEVVLLIGLGMGISSLLSALIQRTIYRKTQAKKIS